MNLIPEILEKCVAKLKSQGKKESSAYAICTASLKKAGKLDDLFLDDLADINEGTEEFEELEAYLEEENALLAWSAPTKRKDIPDSHFFDPKNKKYPYRNADGSVNCGGVMAAWKMANGARSGKKASPSIVSKIRPYRDKYMNSNKKKSDSKKQEAPFKKFLFQLSEDFSEEISLAEGKSAKIQALKKGRFKHPWWGVLRFDDKFFNSLIANFNSNIPQESISFDFKHQPDWGAAAWVEKLFVEDDALMASVSLTDKGREAIKKKEFKYFSIEYTDDYVEYQFSDVIDDEGRLVEKEEKISYGPTVLGGGLTNRPFIKGMKPVSLSEDGEIIEFTEINEDEEVEISMKELEELKAKQKELEDQIKKLTESKDSKVDKTAIKALEDNLKTVTDQVKELSEKKEEEEEEEENSKSLEELTAAKKELEDTKKALSEKDKEMKKLSDDVKALSDSVTALMASNQVLQEDKYKINVERKLDEYRKAGAFPATIEVIKPVLIAEGVRKFSVTLSEDGKETKKSLADVVSDILNSIPQEYRFTEEETTTSPRTPTGNSKELSVEDVEKYATDKKLSYEEALIALAKEGKIS